MSIRSIIVATVVMFWAIPALADEPFVFIGSHLNTQRIGDGYSVPGDQRASAQRRLVDNPNNNPTPDSTAEVRGWADLALGLGSYSAVTGSERNLQSQEASIFKADNGSSLDYPFSIQSDTLPAGTAVSVNMILKVKGSFTTTGTSRGLMFANADLIPEIDAPHQLVYQSEVSFFGDTADAGGDLWIANQPTPDAVLARIKSSVTKHAITGGLAADVDWMDTFSFPAVVGENYTFDMSLNTSTWAEHASDVQVIAAFDDTASASLVAADSTYRIVAVVPEPAAMSMLLLGISLPSFRRARIFRR